MNPTPQAQLPTYRTIADEIRDINATKKANTEPPRIITLSGNSDIVFDARPQDPSLAVGGGVNLGAKVVFDKMPTKKLTLHNLGTHPIYYAVNSACSKNPGGFHDILAGGSVANDGLGSLVDLSESQPNWVSVSGTLNDKLAVIISYPLESSGL